MHPLIVWPDLRNYDKTKRKSSGILDSNTQLLILIEHVSVWSRRLTFPDESLDRNNTIGISYFVSLLFAIDTLPGDTPL